MMKKSATNILCHLPSSIEQKVQRQVELQRELPERKAVDAAELLNIVIEGEYAIDMAGQRFLLYDSRITHPDDVVFFIFVTDRGIERLNSYHHWTGDGTFKVVPSGFLQLYTINVLIDQSSVPCLFILMANKAQDTYRRAFEVIRNHVNHAPNSVIIDFEQSAKGAFSYIWPDIQLRLCLFHLGQSVLRYVQRNGLIAQYELGGDFKKFIRCLTALSLVRNDRVAAYFEILRGRADPNSLPVFDYFKRTYIIRENGNAPLFLVPTWNHRESVLNDLGRTNNAQEAFHLNLRRKFQHLHPPLSRLITVLKEEERIAQDKVRIYEMDPTTEMNMRPRKPKYIINDKAIKKLVTDFGLIAVPTDDQIVNHLKAIQWRLAKNGYDNWDD